MSKVIHYPTTSLPHHLNIPPRGAPVKITNVTATILKTRSIFVQVFTDAGITGMFADQPDMAVKTLKQWTESRR